MCKLVLHTDGTIFVVRTTRIKQHYNKLTLLKGFLHTKLPQACYKPVVIVL